jgi:hypothetical protein
VIPWAVTMRQWLLSRVKRSVADAALVAMVSAQRVPVVVQRAAMPRQPMAVINPLKPLLVKLNLPLSAYVRPRPLQHLRTAKENNYAATCSS